jgi:hypothetical protein
VKIDKQPNIKEIKMIELLFGITVGIVLTKKLKSLEKIKLPNIPKLPKYKVIVKIGDKYAIRKGYFCDYRYKDLNDSYWWCSEERRDQYCLGSKEQVKSIFCAMTEQETVVDLS